MPPYPVLILLQLIWAVGLAAGSLGVGRWLLRRAGWARPGAPGDARLGLGLGLALFSYAVFALAAAHALSRPVLTAAAAIWAAGGIWLAMRTRVPGAAAPRASGFELAALGAIAALGLLNALGALTPAVDWDGLAYHLALPKIYLQAGGFVFRPDIFHNLFPQFTEMLFLPGLIFPYGTAPKLIHLGFGLLASAAIWALGREVNRPAAGALGALMFYAQYLVHLESGTAFVDLAAAAYVALAMLPAARYAGRPGETRWLYLAVLLVGMTGAVKWQGLILAGLAAGAAGVVILFEPGRNAGEKFRAMVVVGVLACLPAAPYLVRNWVESGNPVWPLGFSLFGGKAWDAEAAARVVSRHTGFGGVTKDWLGFLRLPWDGFWQGARYGHGGHELRWPLLGGVILIAAGWIARLRQGGSAPGASRVLARALWTALAVYLVIWFRWLPQELRYLLPLFPPAAWLLARGVLDLWGRPGLAAKTAAAAGGLLFFAFHPPLHHDSLLQAKTLAGAVSPEQYLEEKLDTYSACRFLNSQAGSGERVLIFGDNQGFYLDAEYLWGDPLLQNTVDYRRLETPARLLARLDELGIVWVLHREGLFGPDYLPPQITSLMDAAMAQGGQKMFSSGRTLVYRLNRGAPVR